MSLFAPVQQVGGSYALALCARCQKRFPINELTQDPNVPGLWVCEKDKDLYDPWRLPARNTEKIELTHPRPDVDISTTDNEHSLVPTP
jgi:hypothetical protein